MSFVLAAALSVFAAGQVMAESWNSVDGNGTNGINVDTTKNAGNPKLIDFNGTLFAIWSESTGTTSQIRVKKYENGAWVTADNNTPLNKDPAKDATYPVLAVFNNELYAAWQEASTYTQLRVAKFNGTSWSRIDGDGIKYNSNSNARRPQLIVYNSSLYVIWEETVSLGGVVGSQVRIKKYDGGTSWVEPDGDSILNYDDTDGATYPVAAVYGSKLYVAWEENIGVNGNSINQIRVKSFDGSAWTFVDGDDIAGLNIDSTKNADEPFLQIYNGELYVAWHERSSKTQVRVKKYNGLAWTLVDGGTQTTGLNQNTGDDAYHVRLAVFDGNLYATWNEKHPTYHIRVKTYDDTSWVSADGNGEKGMNYDTSRSATYGYLSVSDSSLYITFLENNDSNQAQVRVAQLGPDNNSPTATGVGFTGPLKEGGTLTGTYTYGDTENDPEGTTTFKWYTADDTAGTGKAVISGATTNTLSLTGAQVGKYIIFEVTPVATAGSLTGTPASYTGTSAVLANQAPTATGVSFTGALRVGITLTGTYVYADADNDPEGEASFQWYRATDSSGSGRVAIAGATSATFTLTPAEAGSYIVFEVAPKAASGTTIGTPSSFTGSTAVLANAAPTAGNVAVTGSFILDQTVTGSYTYADDDGDSEAGTTFQWYTAEDAGGANKTAIAGATSKTLTIKAEQYGKYLIFEVTPAAAAGTTTGIPASSQALGPVGVLQGDVNGDGLITPADALYVTKYTQGKITLTDEQKKTLDMNGDNVVDAADAQLILSIYLGKGV